MEGAIHEVYPNLLNSTRIRLFPVEKKDRTQKVVQDLWSLNANTFVDKYSTMDVQECIAEIGHSWSTVFSP